MIQALECGAPQAFLPLPIRSDPFAQQSLAEIQFLESDVLDDDLGPCLRAGRLATVWNEQEVGPSAHELMVAERDRVWRDLRAAARPARVEDLSGKPLVGARIGPHAAAVVIADGLLLAPMAGRARYQLRA